ncbi:hypothetical protein AKJ16_DCAP22634 [Drosera capensis]
MESDLRLRFPPSSTEGCSSEGTDVESKIDVKIEFDFESIESESDRVRIESDPVQVSSNYH